MVSTVVETDIDAAHLAGASPLMRQALVTLVPRLWGLVVGRFAQVSGRVLRPTTSGRFILVLAFAVGFAAMNTGNNLLFFGWGLVLSAIIVSGILSESTLRATSTTPLPAGELRAGRQGSLPVALENHRRVPAFGVGISFVFADDGGADDARTGTSFELRLSPGAHRLAQVPWTPRRRGLYPVATMRVATAAPFGFFTKERLVPKDALPPGLRSVLVVPERVDTRSLGRALWARLGETPAGQAGAGDEFFSLRPFRDGDDPRRIAWKPTARTGRQVVRENEATRSREIVIALRTGPGATDGAVEDGVATAASLAEDLLADQHAVGVVATGVRVPPGRGPRQRVACLQALATFDAGARGDMPARAPGAVLIVVAVGSVATDDADVVVGPIARGRA